MESQDNLEAARQPKKPFVVAFWRDLFEQKLKWLSIFQHLAFGRGEQSWVKYWEYDRSVDFWATAHLAGSFTFCFAAILFKNTILIYPIYLLMIYGAFRVVEILLSILRTLILFNPISRDVTGKIQEGRPPTIRGYRRSLILVVYNFIEIVFWFAVPYGVFNWFFEPKPVDTNSIFMAIFASFTVITSFGIYPQPVQGNAWGYVLIFIESLIGVSMALAIITRFVGLIPVPKSEDPDQ